MKKITLFLLVVLYLLCFLSSCATPQGLEIYLSELRSEIFAGSNENLSVKAFYGFKETPYHNDGKIGTKDYFLSFRLANTETTDVNYYVVFNHNGKEFVAEFKAHPVSHLLIAEIPLDDFSKKEFEITIRYAENQVPIKLSSLLPKETISYKQALDNIEKNQPQLLKSCYVDDVFSAEIYQRILVKDGKPFWYVGFAYGNDRLKALLVDGISGEILAIRELL